MKLDFIPLDRLSVSRTNMRFGKRPPEVADILPSIRARGVIQPILVRPNRAPGDYEIVAGARRFTAAVIVADERRASGGEIEPLPCAILDGDDDAAAVEASLIENVARLDPDEVTQWISFTRLAKEGRTPDDIAATFGLPELAVKRVLALGNLLPRIRALYAEDRIDRATIRLLTLASKRQQQDWLRLADDSSSCAPTGQQLKAWLLGGQAIPVSRALFDVAASGLGTVADLFGEERCFADADAFWTAQDAAIAARRAAYLADGWSAVTIVPASDYFHAWEYEKTSKRKGGRVYIDVRANGEVAFHEGYVSRQDARRAAKAQAGGTADTPARPEITTALQTYVDLHRHAATRAALTAFPQAALRLLVAHVIAGSRLFDVRVEPQACRDDATRESVETCPGETAFDAARRAVLALLDMHEDEPTVIGAGRALEVSDLFARLLALADAQLLDVVTVVIGESLAVGSLAVEAVGAWIGVPMDDYWTADTAFFDLLRDKEVLAAMLTEVAGDAVASANRGETGRTLKAIIANHLDGSDGRPRLEHWVPKWMAFPPAAYTARGGVGTVSAHQRLVAAAPETPPEPPPGPAAPAASARSPDPDKGAADGRGRRGAGEPEALAA
jgi:ParB family chromosome partitioning protein